MSRYRPCSVSTTSIYPLSRSLRRQRRSDRRVRFRPKMPGARVGLRARVQAMPAARFRVAIAASSVGGRGKNMSRRARAVGVWGRGCAPRPRCCQGRDPSTGRTPVSSVGSGRCRGGVWVSNPVDVAVSRRKRCRSAGVLEGHWRCRAVDRAICVVTNAVKAFQVTRDGGVSADFTTSLSRRDRRVPAGGLVASCGAAPGWWSCSVHRCADSGGPFGYPAAEVGERMRWPECALRQEMFLGSTAGLLSQRASSAY